MTATRTASGSGPTRWPSLAAASLTPLGRRQCSTTATTRSSTRWTTRWQRWIRRYSYQPEGGTTPDRKVNSGGGHSQTEPHLYQVPTTRPLTSARPEPSGKFLVPYLVGPVSERPSQFGEQWPGLALQGANGLHSNLVLEPRSRKIGGAPPPHLRKRANVPFVPRDCDVHSRRFARQHWQRNASVAVYCTVLRGVNSGSCGAAEDRPILRLFSRVLAAQVGCPVDSPSWEYAGPGGALRHIGRAQS